MVIVFAVWCCITESILCSDRLRAHLALWRGNYVSMLVTRYPVYDQQFHRAMRLEYELHACERAKCLGTLDNDAVARPNDSANIHNAHVTSLPRNDRTRPISHEGTSPSVPSETHRSVGKNSVVPSPMTIGCSPVAVPCPAARKCSFVPVERPK